ncbi:activating signal cointegrator 1 complex subunit 2 isoform X2 [Andrena cerasifolii]|uniref:activating signal cointegrator 1 complex subunit 2 isoform X2 n=1 Tax=Andrena cerasifolii TaxID=2819439 RepID=UPI004037EC0F
MTDNVLFENMERFENPKLLPLEDLKLKTSTGGVVEHVDALSKRWVDERYFLHYEAPVLYDDKGAEIAGAKEHWMEIVRYMIDDLRWLLSLPFYRFWSNIAFNTSILNALVSFLQEAPPFYALEYFPNSPEMLELLQALHRYVLMAFTRFVTNKEDPKEHMSRPFLGNLLYENYIFTVPIIFDLCQLYGRENPKIMKKILNCLFTLEPKYNNDLKKTVPRLIEALENVDGKFGISSIHNSSEAVSLSRQNTGPKNLTLFNLEDMILYVLDISSTLTVFLKNYPPAVSIFHEENFMKKILSTYESTMPEMYKQLDKLGCNDKNMPKYMELKHRLDVTRIEMLNLFHTIINQPILSIEDRLETISDVERKEIVEEYLTCLDDAVSEKEFITDYDQLYPVGPNLKSILTICPEIDTIKCDYIMKLLNSYSLIEESHAPSTAFSNNEAVAGPSGIQNRSTVSSDSIRPLKKKKMPVMKNNVQLALLVSEVKDILHDLDEQFIQVCLENYGYNTESVINAVLEDTLPSKLKALKDLKSTMNDAPVDDTETYAADEDLAFGFERMNVASDFYDDVHEKTREIIPVPKDYITRNYSLVDEYEDEYDDTYDNCDIRAATRDSVEADYGPFTTPRVLLEKQKVEVTEESESENEGTETEQNGRDHFIQNPAELRAKAEQRRAARGGKQPADVVGKSRGRGQEKNVLYNRQQKNTHKDTRANHNRRSGAQFKRSQGMVSS